LAKRFGLKLESNADGPSYVTLDTDNVFTENNGLRVLIGGDICPVHRVEPLLIAHDKVLIGPFKQLFDRQDLVIGNLECPLTKYNTPIAKVGPQLRAQPECAPGLKALGFDVLTLANNHMMDMGEEGLRETLQVCDSADLLTVGAGLSRQQIEDPLIVERKGTKIGLIAIAENEFSTISSQKGIGCCPLDVTLNTRLLRKTRDEVEFLIVLLHGGNEHYPYPSPRFADLCRFFVEMGADAVVCHHTHTISGIEIYRNKPIVYGVGNLLFDSISKRPATWYKGMFVEIAFNKVGLVSLRLFPFQQCSQTIGLAELDNAENHKTAEILNHFSEIIAHPEKLENEWRSFCRNRRFAYLIRLYGFGWFRVRLYMLFNKIGIDLFRYHSQKKRLRLLNSMRCEAHRYASEEILRKF
jgi:hypothetical protein